MDLPLTIPSPLLDALADAIAARVGDKLTTPTASDHPGWLNVKSAAQHLDCPVSRIHDLVQRHALTPRRDGTRLLFRASDLDAYVETTQ